MSTDTQVSMPQDFDSCPGANSFVVIALPEGAQETIRYDAFVALLFKNQTYAMMKMHAALGICGEAGELADAIKRDVIYEKGEDRKNVVEELGDLRFYMQAAMQLHGITEQEVLQENANKLCVRYKSLRYSNAAAQQRADKSGSSQA